MQVNNNRQSGGKIQTINVKAVPVSQDSRGAVSDRFKGGKARKNGGTSSSASGLNSIKSVGSHSLDASRVVPQEVRAMVGAIAQKYGLPFDPSQINLAEMTPDQVNAMTLAVDNIKNNSKLLPIIMKNMVRLFKAEVNLAKFNANLSKEACAAGYEIDKATAQAYAALFGYQKKQELLNYKLQKAQQMADKVTDAKKQIYDQSAIGLQSQLIDAQMQQAGAVTQAIGETKLKQIQFNTERKTNAAQYLAGAFETRR